MLSKVLFANKNGLLSKVLFAIRKTLLILHRHRYRILSEIIIIFNLHKRCRVTFNIFISYNSQNQNQLNTADIIYNFKLTVKFTISYINYKPQI